MLSPSEVSLPTSCKTQSSDSELASCSSLVSELLAGIAKQDALLFSKTTRKLKTGNECAHQFHETCFGSLYENDAKFREIKEKLEELLKKHKQLYKFTSRANLKTSSRRVKKGRTMARTRKIKRREANIDKIIANISSSYKSSGVIDELDLSKVCTGSHPS